ncbi:MAG: hypothetical protein KDI56_01845 [Xanthomonadales bacterium]|nr:hypothetical protein [Xanthomonadales bacterium]
MPHAERPDRGPATELGRFDGAAALLALPPVPERTGSANCAGYTAVEPASGRAEPTFRQRNGAVAAWPLARRSPMNDAEFGQLLRGIERSDPQAWQSLMQLVYSDLKRIAHRQLARVDPGQTLSTTVLVHETFEKLAVQGGLPVQERSDFYALCAHAMRQILVDHYRRRSADKRAAQPAALADHELRRVGGDIDSALLELGRGLDLLARHDQRLLQVFEMRYFGGLSDVEIGRRLDLSERSVQRQVARARAWVMACLDEQRSIP